MTTTTLPVPHVARRGGLAVGLAFVLGGLATGTAIWALDSDATPAPASSRSAIVERDLDDRCGTQRSADAIERCRSKA